MKHIKISVLCFLLIAAAMIGFIAGCLPDVADIDPPFVQILFPAPGAFVNGTVPVAVVGSDDDELSEIRIYIDGVVVAKAQSNYVSYMWDTDSIADNLDHYLAAVAIDGADNVGYSGVVSVRVIEGQNEDILPPVVSILYPVSGQLITGTVNIVAEAQDDSEVERVEFYIDGYLRETVSTPPFDYLWDTTTEDSGSHAIFLRAYDANNNSSASNTITVKVIPTAPEGNLKPVVRIASPQRNRVLLSKSEMGSVPIEIETQNAVAIEKVELYIDGHLQAVLSENVIDGIRYEWDLDDYGDGLMHTIFVKAIGGLQRSTADMIVVTVNP